MFVGAAFLIARASATGIADATFANGAMLIANNVATARIDTRFLMTCSPLCWFAARAVVRRRYLVAAPNSTDRPIVAADGDSVASVVAVPVIPTTVVVTVAVTVTVTPHSHIASGGFDTNLCGSGRNNRRGDSDTRNRQQTKQNGAHE